MIAGVGLVRSGEPDAVAPPPAESRFAAIFNGADLAGWVVDGGPPTGGGSSTARS